METPVRLRATLQEIVIQGDGRLRRSVHGRRKDIDGTWTRGLKPRKVLGGDYTDDAKWPSSSHPVARDKRRHRPPDPPPGWTRRGPWHTESRNASRRAALLSPSQTNRSVATTFPPRSEDAIDLGRWGRVESVEGSWSTICTAGRSCGNPCMFKTPTSAGSTHADTVPQPWRGTCVPRNWFP